MASMTERDVMSEAAKPLPYFSHDSNAAEDIKSRRLIRRGGYEAYGRWWRLCELMAFNTGHRIPISTNEDMDILCDDLKFSTRKDLMDFVQMLTDVGLVSVDALGDGELASERMDRNAAAVGKQRAAGKLGGRPKKGVQNHA
jgi:hypothetical protein